MVTTRLHDVVLCALLRLGCGRQASIQGEETHRLQGKAVFGREMLLEPYAYKLGEGDRNYDIDRPVHQPSPRPIIQASDSLSGRRDEKQVNGEGVTWADGVYAVAPQQGIHG